MKKRLLFLDLDGALIDDVKEITAGNRAVLERTLERGHGVAEIADWFFYEAAEV